MQSARRVYFNPTSLPHLRTPRFQTRNLYSNGAYTPRPNLRIGPSGSIHRGEKLRGVRRKTNQSGEDNTGHISAGPNEGILFFDSQYMHLAHPNLERRSPMK